MTFNLRDYQHRLATDALSAMAAGQKPVAVSATGSGKSAILAEIARQLLATGQSVIVTCHRREILLHLERTIEKHCGIKPAVISADNKARLDTIDCRIKVAMVPTLSKRKAQIPESWIGTHTLLCDEAHHCPAPSHYNLIELLKPLQLAGCTATPVSCRSDRSLGDVFDTLLLGPEPDELVRLGFLAPVKLYAADSCIDTTGVRVRGGDYVLSDLEAAARKIAGSTVQVWKKYNPDQAQTLVACCGLDHASDVAEQFRAAGIRAATIDGTMPTAKRDQIIEDFSNGTINVLCFVSLIDEGLDIPEAECLVFCRPTKSLRLRRQLEGRVRRIHPGKKAAIVIDQTSSWRFLPLPNDKVIWSLDGNGEAGAKVERSHRQLVERTEGGAVQVIELTGAQLREIELASRTWRQPPELITALRNGPAALKRLCQSLRYADRRRMGAIKALRAWPASLEELEQIGDAMGWRPGWAISAFRRAVEEQSLRYPADHAAAAQALRDVVADAITAGELRPAAAAHIRLVGLRIAPPEADQPATSWLVTSIPAYVAAGLQLGQKAEAIERLIGALEPRLEAHGHRLEPTVMGLEMSQLEAFLASAMA